MKLTPDDPRLSAYLLGELPSAESAAVERAVAADPALRLALDELRGTVDFLERTLSTAPVGLRADQREAIRRAGREADAAGKIIELASARRGRNPWYAAIGAAAAVVVAIGLMSKIAGPGGRLSQRNSSGPAADEIALLPMHVPSSGGGSTAAAGGTGGTFVASAPVPQETGAYLDRVARRLVVEPLPDATKLPRVQPVPGFTSASEIQLPSVVGYASYAWIRYWMAEKDGLPPRDMVRIEELVNAFPLPVREGASVASARCPWNPQGWLVACTLEGPRDFTWSFRPVAGATARLLAAPGTGKDPGTTRLPENRTVTVLLEVVPGADGTELGEFEIRSAGGETTRFLAVSRDGDEAGMRQLGLMAAFGLWLRGEGIETGEMNAILDAAGTDGDPGRADARRTIRRAIDRASAE